MTTDTKKLAEFAKNFLPDIIATNWGALVIVNEITLFKDNIWAPHLAHLAKRGMEKRGYAMGSNQGPEAGMDWQWKFLPNVLNLSEGYGQHENEYIALWSAIEATGEK